MNWNALDSIDWESLETTEDWAKTLNDLRGLIDSADNKDKRAKLAAKLDEFADHSVSDDLVTITKLDTSARRAARALRSSNVSERIQELSAASKEYQAAVKEFSAATAGLKKEASLLRAEKVTEAVRALTATISSLKTLSQVVGDGNDAKVGDAISEAVNAAKKLRDILERPA
jgi:hypothetical protein